ncbi:MAG: hypothetical protein BGP11_19945 [Rhodobacterales bacterium 65-51]|uniref:Uncharacterized protein n=2 Tax=Pseudodonghicola xiamenensis TaxID=337702 RepID=A0A8J3H814_9RHOB|nr:MAG: hypothetical protein BGP11_19945 [Rhodobacterales bacterium 65-51]GHG89318.1 hypothetical protein GCM10010961_18890 [Pseudodonghicola xiamenensis]
MGTSGSFGGGKPMVPSWVGDPAPEPAAAPTDPAIDGPEGVDENGLPPAPPAQYPPIVPPGPGRGFGSARGDMTSGTRSGSPGTIRRGAGKFVAASGGGRAAARQMVSSRALAGGVVGLARAISESGPAEALRRFNIEALAGAPADQVFVALTDALCPPGGTIDEAIARDALLETIADLAANGIGNFDELTLDDLQEIFVGVVARSIEGKILNEVGTNAIKLSPDTASVERAQRMLHTFVIGCVRDRLQATGVAVASLNGSQIDGFVSDLYAAAFDLMQTLGEAE